MNDYKYIIKAEYPDGTSYTEQLFSIEGVNDWISQIINSNIGKSREELPKITVKPVAPNVYTLD